MLQALGNLVDRLQRATTLLADIPDLERTTVKDLNEMIRSPHQCVHEFYCGIDLEL